MIRTDGGADEWGKATTLIHIGWLGAKNEPNVSVEGKDEKFEIKYIYVRMSQKGDLSFANTAK